jgi:hypothetical protein
MKLNELPSEILRETLLFLDVKNILNAGLINKEFNKLSKHHFVWKTLLERDHPYISTNKIKNDNLFFETYKEESKKTYVVFFSGNIFKYSYGSNQFVAAKMSEMVSQFNHGKRSQELTSKKFVSTFIKKFGMSHIFKQHHHCLYSSPLKQEFGHYDQAFQNRCLSHVWKFTLAFDITQRKLNAYIENKNYEEVSKHLVGFKNENGEMEEFNKKNETKCTIC